MHSNKKYPKGIVIFVKGIYIHETNDFLHWKKPNIFYNNHIDSILCLTSFFSGII